MDKKEYSIKEVQQLLDTTAENIKKLVGVQKWTDTDMMEFAEWTAKNEYVYYILAKIWMHPVKDNLTTTQLLQEYKDWKEGKND
jgi:hypothetical protein